MLLGAAYAAIITWAAREYDWDLTVWTGYYAEHLLFTSFLLTFFVNVAVAGFATSLEACRAIQVSLAVRASRHH